MTTWMNSVMMRAAARRMPRWDPDRAARASPTASAAERCAGRLADHGPDFLGGVPPRHHRLGDVEAALRNLHEIIDAVDSGEAVEPGDICAQIRRAGASLQLLQ